MENISYIHNSLGIGNDWRFVRVDYISIRNRLEDEDSPEIKIGGTDLTLSIHESTETKEDFGVVISQTIHKVSELFRDTATIIVHGIVRDKSTSCLQEITYDLLTGRVMDWIPIGSTAEFLGLNIKESK